MANVIKIKRGLSSNLSKANLQEGELAYTTDTKKLYISNTSEPINNNTTYAISKSGSTITLTGSDGSTTTVSDSNTTYSAATTSAAGLMSSTDKSKLDGIATGANKTTVDSSLSSSSTNPVQNKVIYNAINGLPKIYMGDTEPTDLNVLLWIDTGVPVEISFTVGSTTLSAEEGMTWAQWVESDYNTMGIYVNGNYIEYIDGSNGRYVCESRETVDDFARPTDNIISNHTYDVSYKFPV